MQAMLALPVVATIAAAAAATAAVAAAEAPAALKKLAPVSQERASCVPPPTPAGHHRSSSRALFAPCAKDAISSCTRKVRCLHGREEVVEGLFFPKLKGEGRAVLIRCLVLMHDAVRSASFGVRCTAPVPFFACNGARAVAASDLS